MVRDFSIQLKQTYMYGVIFARDFVHYNRNVKMRPLMYIYINSELVEWVAKVFVAQFIEYFLQENPNLLINPQLACSI